jgi:hypothetical protein
MNRDCIVDLAGKSVRCLACIAKHNPCSFVPKVADAAEGSGRTPSADGSHGPSSSTRPKSPLLQALSKPFRRRRTASKDEVPPPPSAPASSSTQTRTKRSRPSSTVEVSLAPPRSVPVSRFPPAPPRDYTPVDPPFSPYSDAPPASSSLSVNTFSGSSFSSLNPDYNYEFERLQIEYKRSQERLRAEQEHAESQRVLFERDRAETEARHQQELEDMRRRYTPGDVKGKRRQ